MIAKRTKSKYAHASMGPGLKTNDSRGFTLIETLVAITILLTSIAGPLTIATKGISSAIFARDQIAAFYLAQEAVEYVRNTRDENSLSNVSWITNLDSCFGGGTCTVDAPNDSIEACSGGTCPALRFDEDSGFYNYATGDETKFTRTVRLESVSATEVSITVDVAWRTGVLDRSFTVRENILDWQ